MKKHLIVHMHSPAAIRYPHWCEVASGRAEMVTSGLLPKLERRVGVDLPSFHITEEYASSTRLWSSEEIEAKLDRVYRLILLQDQVDEQPLLSALNEDPLVSVANLGGISQHEYPAKIPITASFSNNSTDWARKMIFTSDAHLYSRGHAKIIVAVLDTGVDVSHPELQHACLPGYDFVDIIDGANAFIGDYLGADHITTDEVGHGTHVAGIISGLGSSIPIGLAPDCRILPVRVLATMEMHGKKVGAGLIDNINSGIKWAVDQGAHIINMSLGVKHEGGGLPHESVVQYAIAKNVIVVAASGNDGSSTLYYPGALKDVVTVGACNSTGQPASFSTWGSHVTFLAPGEEILSTYANAQYAFSSGTSQATPFVSAAIALLLSYARKHGYMLKYNHVLHLLKTTAERKQYNAKDDRSGYGIINPADALRLLHFKLFKNNPI